MCNGTLRSIVIAVVGLCLFTMGCWSINEARVGGVENRTVNPDAQKNATA
ncbi:MAG: hypothetical protein ACYS9Y_10625 [Planctomycetota bacterium]|jgi:hypothetical protein